MGERDDEHGPWVRTVEWADATGTLKEAYDWQAERLGEPTDFTKLGSLYPDIVMERLRLYRAVEACPSSLAPAERQLAAFVTSLVNGTTHCASGLRVKLAELGVDDDVRAAIEADPRDPRTGDDRLDAILSYAAALTASPATVDVALVQRLRDVGLDDLEVVDLNDMVAYYNYINRVANGLGMFDVIPAEHALRALPR
jgi:uncharacterized peroxidase-related enzyme